MSFWKRRWFPAEVYSLFGIGMILRVSQSPRGYWLCSHAVPRGKRDVPPGEALRTHSDTIGFTHQSEEFLIHSCRYITQAERCE